MCLLCLCIWYVYDGLHIWWDLSSQSTWSYLMLCQWHYIPCKGHPFSTLGSSTSKRFNGCIWMQFSPVSANCWLLSLWKLYMLLALSHSRQNPKGVISSLTMINSQGEILISLEPEIHLLSSKQFCSWSCFWILAGWRSQLTGKLFPKIAHSLCQSISIYMAFCRLIWGYCTHAPSQPYKNQHSSEGWKLVLSPSLMDSSVHQWDN